MAATSAPAFDSRAKELIKQGEQLFSRKEPVLSLWQELAENFYPQRADFTSMRTLGTEFAANLMTSYPVLAQRELSSSFSAMLRPTAKDWFEVSIGRPDKLDNAGTGWLEWASKLQRRAMYDRASMFVRATKEGDADFSAFGQCVISTELNRARTNLLYRCWHLRDVAWCENNEGKIDTIFRKWKPTARELLQTFGERIHKKVVEKMKKDPYYQVNCYHVVLPADEYQTASAEAGVDGNQKKNWITPYVSVYIDIDNQHILEEEGVYTTIYTIPRWQTVSGSQYAHSPATVAALPDARLIQAMTLVLLEAGEKAVNPPMIATQDVVRSDISIFAGGVTYIDRDYDEKLGEALRPFPQDFSGIPLGMEMRADVRQTIMEAFYLNKISLPPMEGGDKMTAYEAGVRVQEYIRGALPLFEPMEMDYNGSLCENTFEILMRAGAFGSAYDMPESLRGQDVMFKFESPLHQAAEKQKGHTLMEARGMIASVIDLDPGAGSILKVKEALRDALNGNETPATWMASESEVEEASAAMQKQQQQQQQMAAMQQGAEAAANGGKAAQSFTKAQQQAV